MAAYAEMPSHRIHGHLMELHKVAREVRKSERVSRLNSDTSSSMDSEIKLEMHNFQDPQVSPLFYPTVFVIELS
jgi:hypothetical protein